MAVTRLPNFDCEILFDSEFLCREEADRIWQALIARSDQFTRILPGPNGQDFELPTGRCMYVDPELMDPGTFHPAHGNRQVWPDELQSCRTRIEALTGRKFATVVAIHYPDGKAGVGFHADLPAFGNLDWIPSISLGAERCFALRSITNPDAVTTMNLPHGSLIVMGPGCQTHYEHAILEQPEITAPRINLTFREFSPRGTRR